MVQHIPRKCKKCYNINFRNGDTYINLEIFDSYGEYSEKEIIIDSGNPCKMLVVNANTYSDLFLNCDIPDEFLEQFDFEAMKEALSRYGHCEKEEIEGGMITVFRLPSDKKYNIERWIPAFINPISSSELIGLVGFQDGLIMSGDKKTDEDLEISFLPNKNIGYTCRGIKDISKCKQD